MKAKLILGIILGFLLTNLTLANWPMFQNNPAHTGKTNLLGPQTNNLSWSLDLGVDISPFGGPSVGYFTGREQIIVGTEDGVYIINSNGILSQHIATSHPVQTVVTIYNNTLYFGAGDTLFAYNTDGLYWSYETERSGISAVTISHDTLYVCDEDYLYSFSLSGSLHWRSDDLIGTVLYAAPAVDPANNIYVVSSIGLWSDYDLYAYYTDGNRWWLYDYLGFEGNGVQLTPTLDDSGNIYLATYYSGIWSSSIQSLKDDNRNWRRDSETLHSSPAYYNNVLYYGVIDGLEARHINGDLLWTYYSDAVKYSSPAIGSDGTIYFGTETGALLALDSSGTLKWTSNISSAAISSPAISADTTLYVAAGQTLFVFKDTATSIFDPRDHAKCDWRISISPNPFNGVATIGYYLPSDAWIKIAVYDILGRLQKNLVNEYQFVGQHQVHLSGLSSGVYFVRLQSDNIIVTKKVTVIK